MIEVEVNFQRSEEPAARLKLAMCNLQGAIGTTRGYLHYFTTAWKYRFPHDSEALTDAARFLEEEALDLVVLCEVETDARHTQGLDQVRYLSERAGLEHRLFFPTVDERPERCQGNAIISRLPIEAVANHRLPGGGEPRFLGEARIALAGVEARMFVTHLSLNPWVRGGQIRRVAEIVGNGDRPSLLAGDFNVSRIQGLGLLLDSELNKSLSVPTFPSWKPRLHLDHLFLSSHFEFQAQHAFQRFRFSDHLPLVAEVGFFPTIGGHDHCGHFS